VPAAKSRASLARASAKPAGATVVAGGIIEEQIENSEARVAVRSQVRFLELAAEALEDDWLGFRLASELDLWQIGLFYYVLASCEKLGESLQRAERYSEIVNEGISWRLPPAKDLAVAFHYVGNGTRTASDWVLAKELICCDRARPEGKRMVGTKTMNSRYLIGQAGCGMSRLSQRSREPNISYLIRLTSFGCDRRAEIVEGSSLPPAKIEVNFSWT
jgi:hypothetical protein